MCGLAGIVTPGRAIQASLLDAMERDLFHRGPDSGGQAQDIGWGLVFRRLAIMDPAAKSDQPMNDADGSVTMVYNGEIYNFRELRRELEAGGVRFRTESDSEVILEGYRAWGEIVFEKLEGMYAVLLLDRRANRLVAARDPLGIKPLYMTRSGDTIAFASEIRPLTRITPAQADVSALGELLAFGWAAGRKSNLKNIDRIPGGTLLSVSLDTGAVTERRFADPIETIGLDRNDPTTAEAADDALDQSIRAHLMSDVGYSLQLSGGVDSSYVAARASHFEGDGSKALRSYGVRIPNYEHDEAPFRAQVAERYNLSHVEEDLDGDAFAEALPRAIRHMEGPVPHGGCVMLMLLCARVRREGGKVVLTGEGADEFFGGYFRYGEWRRLMWRERLAKLPFVGLLPSVPPFVGLHRFRGLDMPSYGALYQALEPLARIFPDIIPPAPGERERNSGRFDEFRDRMLAVDQSAYLESLLVRQDKMSMAESIEARVPFVHLPLARVLNRLPKDIRIPGRGATKPILKKLAERYLPSDVIYRRKIGLWLPYDAWLRDETKLGRFLDDVAAPDSRLGAFGDNQLLKKAVEDFREGRPGGPRMWTLVNTEIWLRSLESGENETENTGAFQHRPC